MADPLSHTTAHHISTAHCDLTLARKYLIHILGVPEVEPRLALAGAYM